MHEEALADGRAAEGVLARAQRAVLTPRIRIEAELAWFPGIPPYQARAILSQLDLNNLSDARERLERLQGLDKANLAAHLCACLGAETKHLQVLLEAYAEFTDGDVHEILKGLRSVSGFPTPDQEQVRSALNKLRGNHARAAVSCIVTTKSPGEALTEIVEAFLTWSNDNVRHLLDLIVREYATWSQPQLTTIKERIEEHIALRRNWDARLGAQPPPVEQIVDLLAEWDSVSQPVQLLEESKGLEEPRSKEIHEIVRDFCIWLANESGQYEDALVVSRALLKTFPELPAVAAQLSEDIDALESLAEKAKSIELMAPLIGTVEAAKAEMAAFNEDVVASGFGPNSRGLAKSLYDAFANVAAKVTGTELEDMPWMVVRSIAIDLNNKHNSPEGASAILEGVVHSGVAVPSKMVLERLTDDLETLRRNLRPAPAWKRALMFLILRFRLAVILVSLLIYLVVSLFGYLSNIFSHLTSSPSSQLSEQTPTPTSVSQSGSTLAPSLRFEEQVPSPGTDRSLDRNEVRYCVFQRERLEILRGLVSSNAEISRFNSLISDFNNRCSNFRYRSGVLQAIEAEKAGRLQHLTEDAQRLLSSW